MSQTHRGIIINTIRYKDTSSVCRIFTEHHGLKVFIIRSGKSAKSSSSNLLQPLMLVEFEAVFKENAQMQQLKNLRIAVPVTEVYFHPVKSTMMLFLDELLAKTIPDDYVNTRLYRFLWNAVQLLDDAIDERNFHIWSLLEISRHYGFYPYVDGDNPHFFDLSAAAFRLEKPEHNYYLDENHSLALLDFLDTDWPQAQSIRIHSSARKILLESLVTFLKLHLENLREIKSLSVLHEVFH